VNVLVLNCGRSSLKFQPVDTDLERAAAGTDRVRAKGVVDDFGGAGILELEAAGRAPVKASAEGLEHKIAVEKVVEMAPLHNPPNVKGCRAAREILGDEVPYLLYGRHGIRRYGDDEGLRSMGFTPLIARDTRHLVSGRPPS
jgi:acetate kinase